MEPVSLLCLCFFLKKMVNEMLSELDIFFLKNMENHVLGFFMKNIVFHIYLGRVRILCVYCVK